MNNLFNPDFIEFINCFNDNEVEYILIGAYSVILHGYPRTTGDLDLWVKREESNYKRISEAFKCFQMPKFEMTLENFLNVEKFDVFRFGRPPVAIDIITKVKGLEFDETYSNRIIKEFDGIQLNYISLIDLKKTKKATGRYKDLDDLEHL